MYLKTIKEIAYKRYAKYSDNDIKETECAVEAYFNRLILIGLRLKGVKYEQCQEIIKNTFIHEKDSLKNGLKLICKEQLKDIYSSKIEKLKELFESFSVVYRNKLVHGAISGVHDKKIAELCVKINKALIQELEKSLNKHLNHSAFDQPKKWGAKNSQRDFTDDEISEFKLGGKTAAPIKYEEAKKEFDFITRGK